MVGSFQSTDKQTAPDQTADTFFDPGNSLGSEKLELMTILQSTLDLKSQLKLFLENLRQKLPIDGLYFAEEQRQLKIKIGRQATHSCGYRLLKEDVVCGEISFKRSTRFSEKDLQLIEEAILLLLVPISNALQYQDAVEKTLFNPTREIIKRSELMSTLNREIELAKRHNHPLALLSLKVLLSSKDKASQTTTLHSLYKSFQGVTSNTDMWFRVGRCEFLLLTHAALDGAERIAGEFEQLETQRFDKGELSEGITIRVGVAALTGTDSMNSLIKRSQQQAREPTACLL